MGKTFLFLIILAAPIATLAQVPVCSEHTIRDAVQNHTYKASDDEFFWSGQYEKPLIGKEEHEKATKKSEAEAPRKNQVFTEHPQRIVVSGSGDMAYEYGSNQISFDDQKAGKHAAAEGAYLRVWKSVDGECEVAATMIRPIESTIKAN